MYNIQVVDMKELVDDIIRAVQVDANILVFVNDDGERTAVRDAIFGWFYVIYFVFTRKNGERK